MERAADKQKVTDQNSLSESEQYPVPLGLVRLQEEKGEKKCGSTAGKADGAPCCSFLVFLSVFSFWSTVCRMSLLGSGKQE